MAGTHSKLAVVKLDNSSGVLTTISTYCNSCMPKRKLDLAKMEKVSRLIFATAWQMADGPVRPKIDKGIPASVTRYPPLQP